MCFPSVGMRLSGRTTYLGHELVLVVKTDLSLKNKGGQGTSLVIQWLRLWASNAGFDPRFGN